MRVVPHSATQDVATVQSSILHASQGGKSFASLLAGGSTRLETPAKSAGDIVAPTSDQPGTAFGFGELGVFGRYGAQVAEGRSPAPELAATPTLGATESPQETECPIAPRDFQFGNGASEQSQPLSNVESASESTFARLANLVPNGNSQATGEGAVPAAPVEEEMSKQPFVVTQNSDGVSTAEGGGELVRIPERKSDGSGVSLLISGTDDALNLVVGSGDERENYFELRRLVEETAADFDMKVSSFQLNGFKPQSLTSALGGNSGSRTR